MFLFQKGQTIDNRYSAVFPHKEGAYAETYRHMLFPLRIVLTYIIHGNYLFVCDARGYT